MNRSQLAHIVRAAADISNDPNILVIGSQAILASWTDDELPDAATRSIEADVAFFDDPDEIKSDQVDGAIGEESKFHESYGIYGQGVGVSTAILPQGWRDRVVALDDPQARPAEAYCLEPHDLVVSKLVAGREKDREFAKALINAGVVHRDVLLARAEMLPGDPGARRRVVRWLSAMHPDDPTV